MNSSPLTCEVVVFPIRWAKENNEKTENYCVEITDILRNAGIDTVYEDRRDCNAGLIRSMWREKALIRVEVSKEDLLKNTCLLCSGDEKEEISLENLVSKVNEIIKS